MVQLFHVFDTGDPDRTALEIMDKRIAELEGKVKTLNLRLKKTGDVLKKDDRAAFERHKVSVEALVRQNFGTAPYYITHSVLE